MTAGFYVSDSFTMSPATNGERHDPGVFNMSRSWGPNQPVTVSLFSGALGAIPYASPPAGLNIDVQIGFYDVSSGPAQFAGLLSQIQVMNLVTIAGAYSLHPYDWSAFPLVLSGTTPANGEFQVGAVMTFWLDPAKPIVTAYNYHLLGTAA